MDRVAPELEEHFMRKQGSHIRAFAPILPPARVGAAHHERESRVRRLWACALGLSLLFAYALGCTGVISEGNNGDGPEPGPNDETSVIATTRMLRLTQPQFVNSIKAVFGDDIEAALPRDVDDQTESFSSVAAANARTSRRDAELYQVAALEVATQVLDVAQRYPVLADCAPDPTEDCTRAALSHFGAQLFRRSLSADELDRFTGVAFAGREDLSAAEDLEARRIGIRYALAALLISPSFLYAPQVGVATDEPGIRRYTGWELANRLALFLWNTIPDESLLAAAEAGELDDAEGIAKMARAMLQDERAANLMSRFFSESWRINQLNGGSKSAAVFPEWSGDMARLYRTEFDLVLRELQASSDASLLDALVSKRTFANRELGAIYGIEVDSDHFVSVELPEERLGLLTSGAFTAANANTNRTSPTHRGLFIFGELLCGTTDPPPEDVDLGFPDSERAEGLTGREIVEAHLEIESCRFCHIAFDPLGLALENFDAIGRFRTTEHDKPIDPSTEIGGQTIAGPIDLVRYLANDKRVPRCISRRAFEYAVGALVDQPQHALMDNLADDLVADGFVFKRIVVALASSPGFMFFREEA